jgi:hypothetical protein
MQSVVELLFHIQDGPGFQALPPFIPAEDMGRMPFSIVLRERVEPGPDTFRRYIDDD